MYFMAVYVYGESFLLPPPPMCALVLRSSSSSDSKVAEWLEGRLAWWLLISLSPIPYTYIV